MSIHYLNGKLVAEKDLLISPRDLGFSRGYAVFDFLVTYGGRPFTLDMHVDRLIHSAKIIGMALPWSKKQLIALVVKTVRANTDGKEKTIKIAIAGGPASHQGIWSSLGLLPAGKPTIIIMVDDRQYYPKELYQKGTHLGLHKFRRYAPDAKTNNYIEAVVRVQRGRATSQLEPLYYDDTQVYEPASSNVFAVIDGTLLTPKSNVLPSVTRDVLLKILHLDIPVKKANFTVADLHRATEVFITASNKEVMPVTKLSGKRVGDGKVGPVTKECMRQFSEFVQSGKWYLTKIL